MAREDHPSQSHILSLGQMEIWLIGSGPSDGTVTLTDLDISKFCTFVRIFKPPFSQERGNVSRNMFYGRRADVDSWVVIFNGFELSRWTKTMQRCGGRGRRSRMESWTFLVRLPRPNQPSTILSNTNRSSLSLVSAHYRVGWSSYSNRQNRNEKSMEMPSRRKPVTNVTL